MLGFTSPLKPLLPFENRLIGAPQAGILFNFQSYLELLDWTGRDLRSDKRGCIAKELLPILTRLGVSLDQWRLNATEFEVLHPKRFNRITPQLDTG